MKENTMARDVELEKVKTGVAGLSFEDKLFASPEGVQQRKSRLKKAGRL